MFKLPYSIIPADRLKKISYLFLGMGQSMQNLFPFLKTHLKQARFDISIREYLSMCILSSSIFFILIFFFISIFSGFTKYLVFNFVISVILSLFIFYQQISYPKIYANRRIKDIERNLLSALQNMLIQLNSGVPLFNILVNISEGGYGEVSNEFYRIVKEINGGKPQIEALEEIAAINPSVFFRKAIWQIVNGMKSGTDLAIILEETINLLSEEQILQIQMYGSQLNPLAMFYMLIVVIAPALGITFLIILSSFISLSEFATKMIFWGFYGIVFFFQIMFIGIIKSRRPNLLK